MASETTASQKCSITLYQTDLKILDEIRNYLRGFGVRKLSDSEALRLACRTIVFNEKKQLLLTLVVGFGFPLPPDFNARGGGVLGFRPTRFVPRHILRGL